jgi:alpha-L-fucosidase
MQYEPTQQSLSSRPRPEWFDDEKFGIFIHWGAYSVPAYAPIGETDIAGLFAKGDLREVFRSQPYAEWYLNSIRIPDSPAAEYHRKTYGPDFSYYQFADVFNEHIRQWDPSNWADLFRRSGAGYVTLVTKHHDGFLLWPSKHEHPERPGFHASRNIVGELTDAVRGAGLRMAYYYSSLLDWSFTPRPITDFVDLMTLSPIHRKYVQYQEAHWRELMANYAPSVLWSDIGYPPGSDVLRLFADFYDTVPDGLINDRWNQVPALSRAIMRLPLVRGAVNRKAISAFLGGATNPMLPPHYDFVTPEYASLDHITEHKWEATRGIGRSFAYNQFEPDEFYLTVPELVSSFVDIISKNGNLLLNVGPTSTGEIPEIQRTLLEGFGDWMQRYEPAVKRSRPWTRFGDNDAEGNPLVRFTRTGPDLNLFLFPGNAAEITVRGIRVGADAQPKSLTTGRPAEIQVDGSTVRFMDIAPDTTGTHVIVIPGGA